VRRVERGRMPDHVGAWLLGLAGAIVAAAVAAVATRVQLLPEVIDLSSIPTGAGIGSLLFAGYGAVRRFDLDRIGRVTLLGTLLGGGVTAAGLVLALIIDVLS
jgi:hypothetical protein